MPNQSSLKCIFFKFEETVTVPTPLHTTWSKSVASMSRFRSIRTTFLTILRFYAFLVPVESSFASLIRHDLKSPFVPKQPVSGECDVSDQGSSIAGKLLSAASVAYGSTMIVYGRHVPSQLQTVMVMRVAGLPTLQAAARELRRNIRQARRSMVRHAPCLMMAQKSVRNLDDQAEIAREVMAKTRAAKADGIITAQEEREICKLRRKQLRLIRRDIKRIRLGSNALYRILGTLDLDEIWEIGEHFLFIATAVLATGNINCFIGTAYAKYFYFANLGHLLLDTTEKLDYPIAKIAKNLICLLPFLPETTDQKMKEHLLAIKKVAAVVFHYSVSAYFTLVRYPLCVRLNFAITSAYMTLQAIVSLVENKGINNAGVSKGARGQPFGCLSGWWGGIFMVILSAFAVYFGSMVEEGSLPLPSYLNCLVWVENFVGKIVQGSDYLPYSIHGN